MKLYESERKVMEILWREGAIPAKRVSELLAEEVGWNKNTTYTVLKKCVEKGAVERTEPGFVCRALIGKEEAQAEEVDDVIERVFGGSVDLLFATLLKKDKLTPEQIENLRRMVDELEGEEK